MTYLDDCRVTGFIVPGATEHWTISTFDLTEQDVALARIRSILDRRGYTPPGTYTRLDRGSTIVMSDTRDEMHDLAPLFYSRPQGRVLVNGLGLGCVVKGLLAIDAVTRVDVVEIEQEVIDLVGSQFTDPRLVIHQGDAFDYQWPAGTRWDRVWHDVWDTLAIDNLSDEEYASPGTYAKLNRRYARRTDWQGAWGQDFLRSRRDR